MHQHTKPADLLRRALLLRGLQIPISNQSDCKSDLTVSLILDLIEHDRHEQHEQVFGLVFVAHGGKDTRTVGSRHLQFHFL